MKNAKKWMAMICIVVLFETIVLAQDDVTVDITADYFGKYIWRGQNLDDDPVFQPGLSVGMGNLTVGIWGNLELTDFSDHRHEFTELDYSLDYSADLPGLDGVGYSLGLIYYDFPNTKVKDTTEAYLGWSFDLPLSPSVTWYLDLDEAEGSYILLGISHSIEQIAELSPDVPVAFEAGASLGWGSGSYDKYYWGTDQSKLNDLVLSASFPFDLGGWTITPSLNYVTLVSDDIRDTDAYGTESDFFFAGIGASKRY
jgi:hypothetical protein